MTRCYLALLVLVPLAAWYAVEVFKGLSDLMDAFKGDWK